MKIASNSAAARDAVSGFAGIDLGGGGLEASLGSSNVSSMQDGARVADAIMACISELGSGVKGQADSVSALATEIEERDKRDGQSVCEAR